jgi:hypothetical protein
MMGNTMSGTDRHDQLPPETPRFRNLSRIVMANDPTTVVTPYPDRLQERPRARQIS